MAAKRKARAFQTMIVALAGIWCLAALPAAATILMVGPGRPYAAPSEAAIAANPGDVIRIEPGSYYDCAIWTANHITIEGEGLGVVLTDRICQGKAIFVIHADDVTVANLTFARARAPDGNGAGIRAEGTNLTVETSIFVNNQEGILADDNPKSTIVIRDSEFDRNGGCDNGCTHGVYAGRIALLRIAHSRFFETRGGHHIRSRAARTEIADSHIEDGANGSASYLVDIPNGGSLVMNGNVLEKGPKNQNDRAAVIIGEEGVDQPTAELTFRHNNFMNDGPPTVFVRNFTATPAQLSGNVLRGNQAVPLSNDRYSIAAIVQSLRRNMPGKRKVLLGLALIAAFVLCSICGAWLLAGRRKAFSCRRPSGKDLREG